MRAEVPPVCNMEMSLGSIFQALIAIRTAASLEPPKRLMPMTLPRNCCGSLISGREMSSIGSLFSKVATISTGAPFVAPITAKQGLNVRRACLDQNDFKIDAVLLAEPQFLVDPQRKLVACGAAIAYEES